MSDPTISVLIPVYNAAATLPRALQSVVAQSAAFHQVILVDDGCSDRSAELIAGCDLPGVVRLRHSTNLGSSAALNSGLAAATGEWVAFLDADDEWLPGKTQAQLRAIARRPDAVISATGFDTCDASGRLLFSYGEDVFAGMEGEAWRLLLRDSAICKPTVLARRAALLAAGPFNTALSLAEDQDMWLRLTAGGPLAYVPAPLVRVHAAGTSLTRADPLRELRQLLPMIEGHMNALAPRMTDAERGAARAERLARTGANLCDAGLWRHGAPLLLRAALAGHRPSASLYRLLRTLPRALLS